MALSPTKLKYQYNEMSSFLSEEEVRNHYELHTQGYFDVANALMHGTAFEGKSLDALISKQMLMQMDSVLYGNICQCWNHDFYWQSIAPKSLSGRPSSALATAINESYGSIDKFEKTLSTTAAKLMGSGWLWVISDRGTLRTKVTPNTSLPQSTDGGTPIMVCDLWEHAYLYDGRYTAKRAEYVSQFIKHINWDFVSSNFGDQA